MGGDEVWSDSRVMTPFKPENTGVNELDLEGSASVNLLSHSPNNISKQKLSLNINNYDKSINLGSSMVNPVSVN